MLVLAKSTTYLTKAQIKKYISSKCPMRLFKNVNLINTDEGLCYCYRMPSKAKLNLDITYPVSDDFYSYLQDHEFRLDHIEKEQFIINSLRSLRDSADKALNTFCSELNRDEILRYNKRVMFLRNAVNRDCTPKLTRTIKTSWNDLRSEALKKVKFVKL